MNYEYQYKIGSCLICKQGYLEIVKEEHSGKMFICCDECEAEWENPEDALQKKNGSRQKYGKIIEPSLEDIQSEGWGKYIMKE